MGESSEVMLVLLEKRLDEWEKRFDRWEQRIDTLLGDHEQRIRDLERNTPNPDHEQRLRELERKAAGNPTAVVCAVISALAAVAVGVLHVFP